MNIRPVEGNSRRASSICPSSSVPSRPQEKLKRIFGAILQIDHGGEPTIPVGYAVEKGHDGDGGGAQGQNDPDENHKIVGAVNIGRFLQLPGNALEGGAHHDQIPGRNGAG